MPITCFFMVIIPTAFLSDGQEVIASWDEVYDTFDAMSLQENLLRGIYAYGRHTSSFMYFCI